jgi:hypothetical protein
MTRFLPSARSDQVFTSRSKDRRRYFWISHNSRHGHGPDRRREHLQCFFPGCCGGHLIKLIGDEVNHLEKTNRHCHTHRIVTSRYLTPQPGEGAA